MCVHVVISLQICTANKSIGEKERLKVKNNIPVHQAIINLSYTHKVDCCTSQFLKVCVDKYFHFHSSASDCDMNFQKQ